MAGWTPYVLLAAALVHTGALQAKDAVSREGASHWYGSLYGGWAAVDDGADTLKRSPLAGAGLDRFVTDDLSLAVNVERVTGIPGTGRTPQDFSLYSASLMARYYLDDVHETWRPYMVAGLGLTDFNSNRSDDSNLCLAAGAGMSYSWRQQWSAYAQAMYRRDTEKIKALNRHGLNDVVLSAGLNYAFDW